MRELNHRSGGVRLSPARAFAALAMLVLLLPGCSTGNLFGSSSSSDPGDKLGTSLFGPQAKPGTGTASVTPDDFECPGVEIRPGASTLSISGKGGESAALDLRYQGTIVRTARDCQLRAGNVTIRVGVEGRIVLGPAGGPGQIDIPIRYAVVQEGTAPKTIVTKFYRIPVTVPENEGRVTFNHIAEDLAFPMPVPAGDIDSYVVYIGFDPNSAPEPKPKKPAPKTAPKPKKPAQAARS
jgi:hypothetical protein